ncbi:1,3-beta-glucanosyltransferase gel3 [Physcia stellaris]|nr:1,3-beta-glucanosyltransferase gel3 [Physcia stellaris]
MGPRCSQRFDVWLLELFSLILLVARTVQSQGLEAIEIKGSKFFFPSNGSQFFIRGIIYQQVPSSDDGSVATNLARASADNLYVDPLTDGSACVRDIPYLQKLRINVVRSYGIDPGRDHSSCMNDLANAGIYVLADLPAPGLTISDKNPVWNDALYDRYTQVIDAMHNFTNLFGFIIGDNVIQGISQDDAGPYVKAAVRDMKAYIKQKDYRMIPIGYVNDLLVGNGAVIDPVSKNTWEYLNCGNANETIDFFGGNAVSFCKDSSFQTSGYKNATEELSNYSIPTFLASYGCGQRVNRDFDEIQVIYSTKMTSVWSGGIIYEYFQQDPEPGYGLVLVDSTDVSTLGNFRDVSTNMASQSPRSVASASYQPSNTPASCPAAGATELPPNPRAAVLPANSSTSTSPIESPSATAPPLQTTRDGLSSGGKAGIGIGVAIATIAIAAGLFLLHKRRNARSKQNGDNSGQWNKSELAANHVDREDRGYIHMAASHPRAEMDGAMVDREAPTDRPVVEASAESEIRSELPARLNGVSTKD